MDLYTEPPITSFFPRIATYKKRKIHTEIASSDSSNKRQRDHISTTSRQGIKSKAKEDGQERHDTLDNEAISILHLPSDSVDDLSTTRPAQSSERHLPRLPSLNAMPQTPKPDQLPPRNKRNTSLQTPPPTDERAERQRLMELTPTFSISWKSPDLSTGKNLLPTPSTLGGSASRHHRHFGNDPCRIVPGQDLLLPTRSEYSETPLKASLLSVSIPSSQSQLMANTYFEDEHHLTLASAALPCKHGVQSSPTRISLNRINKEGTFYTTQTFIASSQSQFLSSLEYENPQRSQPSPNVSNSELEIIPSSQSQENELGMLSDPKARHQSMHSRKQALPQRTLSDELFSVSILQNDWPDCNLDPEQLSQGAAEIPCVTNHDNDSATESESEPETEEKDSYRDHCLTPLQSQPSQPSTAGLASLNEGSQHKDSCDSQQSSQDLSLADETSSFASLPGAVKEFRRMFGSDDGSYPPDFPTSLR